MGERRHELQAQRQVAGFSQEQLGERVGVSANAVRSWEAGTRVPLPRHRQPLADALQITLAQVNQLLGISSAFELSSDRVPQHLRHYDTVVDGSAAMLQVATSRIPALLQTRPYACAIEPFGPLALTEQQLSARVELRIAQQRVLRRYPEPLRLTALIAEPVLWHTVGSAAIMAEQLDHLLAMAERSTIEIRLLPTDGRSTCILSGFELLTQPGERHPCMAVVAGIDGIRYVELPETLGTFTAMARYVAGIALPADESYDRIERIRSTRL